MKESFITEGTTHILYDSSVKFEPLWFDGNALESKGMLIGVTNIGRTKTLFFSANSNEYVLKHYHRGGLLRFLIRRHYLYTSPDSIRSFAEWRMFAYLHQQGLPVPRPVAARYTLHLPYYTASLITASCRPAIPLSEFLGINTLDKELWFELGKLIRKFHKQGVYLPDLNASNILYDNNTRKFWFIDFDATKVYPSGLDESKCKANINRLKRSFEKIAKNVALGDKFHYSPEYFTTLRQAYADGGE